MRMPFRKIRRAGAFVLAALSVLAAAARIRAPGLPPAAPASLAPFLAAPNFALSAAEADALARAHAKRHRPLLLFRRRTSWLPAAPAAPRPCILVADLCAAAQSAHSNQIVGLVRFAVLARDVLGCRAAEPMMCLPPQWGTPRFPASWFFDLGGWKASKGRDLFLSAEEAIAAGVPERLVAPDRAKDGGDVPVLPCLVDAVQAAVRPVDKCARSFNCSVVALAFDRPGFAADALSLGHTNRSSDSPAILGVPVPYHLPILAPARPWDPDPPSTSYAAALANDGNRIDPLLSSLVAPRAFFSAAASALLALSAPPDFPLPPELHTLRNASDAQLLALLSSPAPPRCPEMRYLSAHLRSSPEYLAHCTARAAAARAGFVCGADPASSPAVIARAAGCSPPLPVLLSADLKGESGLASAVSLALRAECGAASPAHAVEITSPPAVQALWRIAILSHSDAHPDPLLRMPVGDIHLLASWIAGQVLLACGERFLGSRRTSFTERAGGLRGWAGKEGGWGYLPALVEVKLGEGGHGGKGKKKGEGSKGRKLPRSTVPTVVKKV
ncbi:hypothetical protein DFJ74DRAFT_767780 [Hyaloraphidium curvatum]|nr:hypothetical protein DFJ74DRAFT_767780 [Hyaloraphidium curvatum]